ncbi:major capsid protein [Marinobacter mangrovi]|uniref:major capsid protein n=1 Tax=Marinobacter mangrovi TaxID=2803918 RepID=UPI001934A75C|nr:major capsid protein [Marinobacter mangrovi]
MNVIDMTKNAKGVFVKASTAIGTGLISLQAAAQDAGGIDTTAVETSINAAKGQGLTVGGYVVAAVAAFAVVGVIIMMVRKI